MVEQKRISDRNMEIYIRFVGKSRKMFCATKTSIKALAKKFQVERRTLRASAETCLICHHQVDALFRFLPELVANAVNETGTNQNEFRGIFHEYVGDDFHTVRETDRHSH